jgi:NAD-dependent dihydropyrimidine dehydrogenase PreA subunit
MSLFTIDPEKCNKDELCVKACPTNVIRMGSPDEMPEPNPDFEE